MVGAFRAAATGQPKESSSSLTTSPAGRGSRLVLEKEPVSIVEHRSMSRSRCSQQQQARTFGSGAMLHAAPRLKDGDKRSVGPAIGTSTNRWFATAGDEPADTDTDTDSDSESEFESTIFGATPAPAAPEPPAAKNKTSNKGRKPRKRRTSNSESAPSAEPATGAEEAPAAAEAAAATATKKWRARKPRKRRTTGNAEPAEGASTATEEEEEGVEEGKVAGVSSVDIPKSRKAAFQRARRAGVAERAREVGVTLDTDYPRSGEEEEQDSDDDVVRSPSSWQEPAKPVRPEGFPFSLSAEGSPNVSAGRLGPSTYLPTACLNTTAPGRYTWSRLQLILVSSCRLRAPKQCPCCCSPPPPCLLFVMLMATPCQARFEL